MRILLATSWPYPHIGGVSSHIETLAAELKIDDRQVLNMHHIIEAQSLFLSRAGTAVKRHLRRMLHFEAVSIQADALSSIILRREFDLIHCHDVMATWAALRARERAGRNFKVLTTIHGPVSRHMVEEGYPVDSPDVIKVAECERYVWQRSDMIIAVDRTQAEIAIDQGANPAKIVIIPNAVDVKKLENLAQSLQIARKGQRPWVFVPRRLSPKNGVDIAVKAMSLFENRPLLIIVGAGSEETRLKNMVKETGLEGDVLFCGGLNHAVMIPLMSASDIVIIPSVPVNGVEEATSLAALEAMALCKPVVASNIGGLKELINNGEHGILVAPGDPRQLEEQISLLLRDDKLRRDLGLRGKRRVEEGFSVKPWFDKHKKIYSQLLESAA